MHGHGSVSVDDGRVGLIGPEDDIPERVVAVLHGRDASGRRGGLEHGVQRGLLDGRARRADRFPQRCCCATPPRYMRAKTMPRL